MKMNVGVAVQASFKVAHLPQLRFYAFFFLNDPAPPELSPLPPRAALPLPPVRRRAEGDPRGRSADRRADPRNGLAQDGPPRLRRKQDWERDRQGAPPAGRQERPPGDRP